MADARSRTAARTAAVLLLLGACAVDESAVQPLPAPPTTAARPPTTPPPDYRAVVLPVAAGRTTTTTAVMGPGGATVRGRVVGPDGEPIVGASVRVERLAGDGVARADLVSGEDGAWSLPDVLGGRYRIRAWRAPDLAMVEPSFVFAGYNENAPVEQRVERFLGTHAVPAVAPSPPVVGQPANLVVQVSARGVDAEGVVRTDPVAGVPVEVAGSGWSVLPPATTVTDGAGEGRWTVVCRQAGVQPLRLVVNGVEPFEVALPACVDPAPSEVATAEGTPGATTTTTRAGATTTRPATATTRAPPTTRPRG